MLEKAYGPVFCVIEKFWCFVCFHFRRHRKCSVTIFYVCPWKIGPYVCLGNPEIELQCSQGKKDTSLIEMCTYLRRKRLENINHEFWIKVFCSVAITSTSSKVGATASKLVPRKEKMGS